MAEEIKKRQICQIFSRVVGWITPTHAWNPGMKEQFKDRITYKLKDK